ncbi:hypothetical protein BGZ65_012614, partial [Modicella reniformis]
PSGVQQVAINVSDDNFGDIFPKDRVEFIDRLKNARKRFADDDGTKMKAAPKSRGTTLSLQPLLPT